MPVKTVDDCRVRRWLQVPAIQTWHCSRHWNSFCFISLSTVKKFSPWASMTRRIRRLALRYHFSKRFACRPSISSKRIFLACLTYRAKNSWLSCRNNTGWRKLKDDCCSMKDVTYFTLSRRNMDQRIAQEKTALLEKRQAELQQRRRADVASSRDAEVVRWLWIKN